MRDLWSGLECPVDPERPSTPHLNRNSGGHGICDALCRLQSSAVVGYLVGTLLVEILITA